MRVVVATPIAGWGGISYQYPVSLLSIVDEFRKHGNEVITKYFVGGFPIDVVRNMIAEEFLASGFDYLVSIDADISVLDPRALVASVNLRLPIVTGVYMMRHVNKTSLVVEKGGKLVSLGKDELKPGLMRVDASGMGCVVIAREVFEKVEKPWFKWTYDPHTGEGMGEDRYFFIKAKRAGIPTMANTHLRCTHTVSKDLVVR